MESIRTVGKCIGRACGLQASTMHNVYEELQEISKLNANSNTRKKRLETVGSRIRSLAATRALKTNVAKLNALRLAHNVLNAQRKNAVLNSRNLMNRYRTLKSKQNKHETERLVEALLNTEIKPIRKIRENTEVELYMKQLMKQKAPENAKVVEARKTRNVLLRQMPALKYAGNEQVFKRMMEIRQLALLSEVTTEAEVERNARKAAAVQRFFDNRVAQEMKAANATYGVSIPAMPQVPSQSVAGKQRRKTRKL